MKKTKLKPGKPLKAKTALKRSGFKRKAAAKFIRCVRCENLKPKFGEDDNGLPVCSSCAGPDIVSTAPKRKKARRRKPKSTLARNKDKMDSRYWDGKCDETVKALMHNLPCILCGKREPLTRIVCGHHQIRRSRSKLYRWHPMNVIPLCENCHLTSITVAAHSENPLAVSAYLDMLKFTLPEHYDWLYEHQDAIRKTDMRGPIEHPDWKAQYSYWASKLKEN